MSVYPRSDENPQETLTFTAYQQGLKCNDGNIDTKDDMGGLWTEGMACRGQILMYCGIRTELLTRHRIRQDEWVCQHWRRRQICCTCLPILASLRDLRAEGNKRWTSCVRVKSHAAEAPAPRSDRMPTTGASWRFWMLHCSRRTRNRTQNKVKVQSRERISDGQALFGRQGPLFSIPRPPVLKINTIDAANHAGAGSSSTTAGMNQVKKMTKATKVRR